MTLDQILAAIDELSPEDQDQLQSYLVTHKSEHKPEVRRRPQTMEEWMAKFAEYAKEFRGDSTDEEMAEIIAAMNYKSKPSY